MCVFACLCVCVCVRVYVYKCLLVCGFMCARANLCVFACVGVVHARVLSGSSTLANNTGTSPSNYSSWEKVRKKTWLHYEEGRGSNSCLGKRNRNLPEGSNKHFNDGNKKEKVKKGYSITMDTMKCLQSDQVLKHNLILSRFYTSYYFMSWKQEN